MIIRHNVPALFAHRQYQTVSWKLDKNLEKLSSGMRINWASDDAAGLAISEKMRTQIRGLNQAIRNAQDGISLLHTAEGALVEVNAILQRLRELAIESANGTYTDEDRVQIQFEVSQLIQEVDRIRDTTHFNKLYLLTGIFSLNTPAASMWFHVGANKDERFKVFFNDMGSAALGIQNLSLLTQDSANNAIQTLDNAIMKVATQRNMIGAWINRLEHTIKNLSVAHESMVAAESRIRDVDMAKEMSNFVRNQILLQSSAAMLSQANTRPQVVLKLLGG